MLNVYLSGEIHSNWRDEIIQLCQNEKLEISFSSPITNHDASDNCGVEILGPEEKNFWKDNKGAKINSIKTRKAITDCDLVVVKFGDKYKQWNAAFDAGYCAAKGIPFVTLHADDIVHPLKEVDQASYAWCKTTEQVAELLRYVLSQK